MKVNINSSRCLVKLDSLSVGDVFEYEGNYFMKTNRSNENNLCYTRCLKLIDKDVKVSLLDPCSIVRKCESELNIFD